MGAFVDLAAQMIRDIPGIRMIAEEAGIPAESINWNGTPRAIWSSVLAEERNASRTGAVLRSLQSHYPENDELWAAGLEYIHSVERSRRQPTMAEVANGTDHVASLVEQLHESLSGQMAALREEVRALGARMDTMENKLEARVGAAERALEMAYVATPFRRSAWLLGFLLFVLPMPLFIQDVRDTAGVQSHSVVVLAFCLWAVSLVAFLYGLGFIRDER